MTLDKNGDGYLDRAEYKELRRLAKKAVRPKKCARTFARTCDLNRDLKLSRQEWGACLANDFTRKFNTWCTCISHHKGKISRTFVGLLDHTCTDQRFFFPSSNLNDCLRESVSLDIFVAIYISSIRYDTIYLVAFIMFQRDLHRERYCWTRDYQFQLQILANIAFLVGESSQGHSRGCWVHKSVLNTLIFAKRRHAVAPRNIVSSRIIILIYSLIQKRNYRKLRNSFL